MRLHKCSKVSAYLSENKIVDERQIWCYAQMKVNMKIQAEPVKLYGLVLVCVKIDGLYLYNAEYNSTKITLMYSCKIADMENIRIKKKLLSTTLCFSKGEESFLLEMDDWKRFSDIFETRN